MTLSGGLLDGCEVSFPSPPSTLRVRVCDDSGDTLSIRHYRRDGNTFRYGLPQRAEAITVKTVIAVPVRQENQPREWRTWQLLEDDGEKSTAMATAASTGDTQ